MVDHEHGVHLAVRTLEHIHAETDGRADHVLELLEETGPEPREHHSYDQGAYEALDSLFRAQADQWSATPEHATHIGEDIIADHQARRHPKPYDTLQDVVHDKVT